MRACYSSQKTPIISYNPKGLLTQAIVCRFFFICLTVYASEREREREGERERCVTQPFHFPSSWAIGCTWPWRLRALQGRVGQRGGERERQREREREREREDVVIGRWLQTEGSQNGSSEGWYSQHYVPSVAMPNISLSVLISATWDITFPQPV